MSVKIDHINPDNLLGLHIDYKTILIGILDKGGFGTIYKARDTYYGQDLVAKVETNGSKFAQSEAFILKDLNDKSNYRYGYVVEPIVKFYGFYYIYNHYIILMDTVGMSLRQLKKSTIYDKFTKMTSLWICKKMLESLKFVHDCGWIHGDVKPSNFCIGLNHNNRKLYVIDFGVTRKYNEKTDGLPHAHRLFIGTARYASPSTHLCIDDGKIGDIWGIYFTVIECLLGQLPWRLENNKDIIRCHKKQLENHDIFNGNLLHPWFEPPGPPPSILLFLRFLITRNSKTFDYTHLINAVTYDLTMLGFNENNGKKLDWEMSNNFDDFYQVYWNNPFC